MSTAFAIPADFYITPSEAARLLNVSVREIDQLQTEGKLRDIIRTPGNHRRFNMREVMSLVEMKERQEQEPDTVYISETVPEK